VIKIRFRPAEFQSRLKLLQNSELIDLLTDLGAGGRKRDGATITTGSTSTTASFHERLPYISTICRRYKFWPKLFSRSTKASLNLWAKSSPKFDVTTKTTDIIMFNSRNLGALIDRPFGACR
jgi:hypothetical protein